MEGSKINHMLDRVLRIIFPRRAVCLGCSSWVGCQEDWICPDCREKLCQFRVGAGMPPADVDLAAFAYVYRDLAANIVRRLKYSGLTCLAPFMAKDMVDAYETLGATGADAVINVPMHLKRRRQRGYNHAELLAREVARLLNLEYLDALECARVVRQQAKLDGEARRRNLEGAFRLKNPVEGRSLILVDDVRTTGATAATCAKALKAGGAKQIILLCYTAVQEFH